MIALALIKIREQGLAPTQSGLSYFPVGGRPCGRMCFPVGGPWLFPVGGCPCGRMFALAPIKIREQGLAPTKAGEQGLAPKKPAGRWRSQSNPLYESALI